MNEPTKPSGTPTEFRPYVSDKVQMQEFTLRAVLLGLIMTIVLGAANAYLGLRAGMTIAATYPAAVIAMAVLRLRKGTILEENIARTVGSIGESVAAGAIFTIPAFVITGAWASFDLPFRGDPQAYLKSTVLMMVGGLLGILFVTLLRRVMVSDPELPYPESLAASEIHKAGQRGAEAARLLFYNMGIGGVIYLLGQLSIFAEKKSFLLGIGGIGKKLGLAAAVQEPAPMTYSQSFDVGGVTRLSLPAVSPAYLGVGYIIGPRLAALNFSGGVLAWGLLVPLLAFFLGPQIAKDASWSLVNAAIWNRIVKPIAVGGMLVGASYTLFRMRKSLAGGMSRAISDLKKAGAQAQATSRVDLDLGTKPVFLGLAATFLCMILLYTYFAGTLSGGLVAALVMLVLGFFFAAVSGNLVGLIGSSNNPISGLTLSTLIIAALLMVAIGVKGVTGVAAVLGVAAVVCVSSAVAGEMLQDLKVGHLLGGTPRSMQIGDILGVFFASLLLFFPLWILHTGTPGGFGGERLPAPQAGLMALLAQGIVGGEMAWPLVIVGILMGFTLILVQVRSPMLFAVGMYLPLETTFAIFVGGVIRWITDTMRNRRGLNEAQKARVENAGVLTASGLIAGEALVGLGIAAFRIFDIKPPELLASPPLAFGLIVLAGLALLMIFVPLKNAGRADEPAPPTAIM